MQAMTPLERGVDDANVESDNPCRRKYRKDAPAASLRKQRCKQRRSRCTALTLSGPDAPSVS